MPERRISGFGVVLIVLLAGPATAGTSPAQAGLTMAEPADPGVEISDHTLSVGDVFRDCPLCPSMAVLPPGGFTMGSPSDEIGRAADEGPAHRVDIARPFAIGRYEVTFAQWDACFAGGGCRHHPDDNGWGRGDRPVINVSWHDAMEYAAWLSTATGQPYRLPSEAEWEYAARAGTGSARPWGDDIGEGHANCRGCGGDWDGASTAPVGRFPPNAFGLYDMLGNVWEDTADCWHADYRGAPGDGSAWKAGDCGLRVMRGGGWAVRPGYVRSANRHGAAADRRDSAYGGFRVARSINREHVAER
jgi:formylglycine-generating enzyme required for sulfatase activity